MPSSTRLPLEISSEIFTLCLPNARTLDPGQVPLIFMRICHFWSTIALSTPSLWTALSFETPCAKGIPGLCNDWINRSNALPLSLSICGSLDDSTAHFVKKHADRLERLEAALLTGAELRKIIVMPLASLTSLTLRQVVEVEPQPGRERYRPSLMWEQPFYSDNPHVCVEMFNIAFYERYDDRPKTYFRTHMRLRHLHLGIPDESKPEPGSSAYILQEMTLPALETLSIPWLDIPSLSVRHTQAETIEGLLGVLPRLTHLDLRNMLPDVFEPMAIQALRQLPSLCSLSVHGFATPTRSQYEEILRVLRTRPKIQSLSITWDHRSKRCPDPDIVEALRQLVAGGMEICVGSGGRNLG
ncbi:hypothetical protein C8R46DRAFT_1035208 [Mycena filopes]|nr:hypothetical protein C8R46DRAFT_1035208 [Mycena filopes]